MVCSNNIYFNAFCASRQCNCSPDEITKSSSTTIASWYIKVNVSIDKELFITCMRSCGNRSTYTLNIFTVYT